MFKKGHPNYNLSVSEKTKRKISKTLKKIGHKPPTPEKGKPSGMLGKHHTKVAKEKIGKAAKGRKFTKEARKKMSEMRKGKKPYEMTEEIRRKISKSHKGKPSGMSGKKQSEQAKRKMSIAKKGKVPHLFTKATRKKMRQRMMGIRQEKAPHWKGGYTSLQQQIRDLAKYKRWRLRVLQRDSWTCQKCGEKERNKIVVHHIKEWMILLRENKIKTVEEAINCKKLWNIDIGMTLCKKCHHPKGRKQKLIKFKR